MNRILRTALAGLSLFALVVGLSVPNIGEHHTANHNTANYTANYTANHSTANHNTANTGEASGHWSRALSLEEVSDESRSVLAASDLERRPSQDPANGGQRQASNLLQLDLDCEPVGGDDVFGAVVSLRGIDGAKLRLCAQRGDGIGNLLHARSRSDFSRAPPQQEA